jgi:hypothetical protein
VPIQVSKVPIQVPVGASFTLSETTFTLLNPDIRVAESHGYARGGYRWATWVFDWLYLCYRGLDLAVINLTGACAALDQLVKGF